MRRAVKTLSALLLVGGTIFAVARFLEHDSFEGVHFEQDVVYANVDGAGARGPVRPVGTNDRQSAVGLQASPTTYSRKGIPPVLTIHARDDDVVPISQAEALHHALQEANVVDEHMIIGRGGHDPRQWPRGKRDEAHKAAIDFMRKYLKDQ